MKYYSFDLFQALKNEKVNRSAQCAQKQVVGQFLLMGYNLVTPDQSCLCIVQ